MKKLLLAGAAFCALIAPAMAADMPVTAPVYTKAPPPVSVFSRTGFYAGVNAREYWGVPARATASTEVQEWAHKFR